MSGDSSQLINIGDIFEWGQFSTFLHGTVERTAEWGHFSTNCH
jgi:hypothetical protein